MRVKSYDEVLAAQDEEFRLLDEELPLAEVEEPEPPDDEQVFAEYMNGERFCE